MITAGRTSEGGPAWVRRSGDADSKVGGEVGGSFLIGMLLVKGLGEAAEGVGEGFTSEER